MISGLSTFFEAYPTPICIYSNRGTHLTAKQTKDFLASREVVHILSPSGSSKSRGMIARANQELEQALKRMAAENLDSGWDLYLSRATRAVNTRIVVALGYTTFEIQFGIQPRMPFELAFPDEVVMDIRSYLVSTNASPDVASWEERILSQSADLLAIRKEVLECWEDQNLRIKEAYDAGAKGWTFNPGDLVMLFDVTMAAKSRGGSKFGIQWPGPYVVNGFAGEHGKLLVVVSYVLARVLLAIS